MAARDRPTRSAVITGLFELVDLCHCPVRVEILLAVLRRPNDVGGLAQRLGLELSHVSRYLRAFEAAGLVMHEREGHRHLYRAGPKARAASRGAGLLLHVEADDGAEVELFIPPHLLARLLEADPPVVVLPPPVREAPRRRRRPR